MTDEPTPTPPAVDRVTYAVDGGVATITIDADAGNSPDVIDARRDD